MVNLAVSWLFLIRLIDVGLRELSSVSLNSFIFVHRLMTCELVLRGINLWIRVASIEVVLMRDR